MFSLRFLRFLLFPIEYLPLSRVARTFLSVAAMTGSLLMLCPASAQAQGGVPLWTNRYDGPANGDDGARAIAVDRWDNVFVTGHSISSMNREDYTTIKYSNAGVPLWTNYYNGPDNGEDEPWAIAVDNSGNVFVTGRSFDPAYSYQECVTVAYSNAGVPLWTNRYRYSPSELGFAIAVDSSGNVFVPSFTGIIKYSGSGTPLWTNFFHGAGLALDNSGNVFVTGYGGGSGSSDYATVAYSNSGVPLWTNRYNGPANRDDQPQAIAVDNNGNVFVTGSSWSGSNVGTADYATVAYSNSGVPLWTNRYNGPANFSEEAAIIAVDSRGNVFVTGWSYRLSDGLQDYATIAYSNSGVPLWTNRFRAPGDNRTIASGIAVDSSGNVFVTGGSSNGTNGDYATIKYSSSIPSLRLDVQLLSTELVLSWTNVGFNLQSAPAITGTFTNLPGATSPYTNPLTAPQQFFRLLGN